MGIGIRMLKEHDLYYNNNKGDGMSWQDEQINSILVKDGKDLGLNPSFYTLREDFIDACRKQSEESLTFKRAINLQHEVTIASKYGMYSKIAQDPEFAKQVKAGAKLCSDIETDIAMSGLVPTLVKSALLGSFSR